MNVTSAAIAPAILTALLTTLIVEYFAKPWLDARKERILEDHRHRRELQRLLISLAVHRGVVEKVELIRSAAPERVMDEAQRMRDTLGRVRDLLSVLHNWRIPNEIVHHLAHGIGRLDGSLAVLAAMASEDNTQPDERRAALATVGTVHDELVPAVDYVILKGRQHRQALISRLRTRRAARIAIKTGQPHTYPPSPKSSSDGHA